MERKNHPISDKRPETQRRSRALAFAFTAALHVIVIAGLLWLQVLPSPKEAETSMVVVDIPKAPGPPDQKAGGAENADQPTLLQPVAPTPVKAPTITISVMSDLLSDSQLSGAASAGEGGGGGSGCDIARRVQQALRRDRLVHAAVENAGRAGRAILLWDGDWVQSGEQDGKGLSAVREAILWEVGFAPEACRNERVHGLVLLSLADGGTRFGIGANDWRWSDLLGLKRNPSNR